jgi:hypothetical protein
MKIFACAILVAACGTGAEFKPVALPELVAARQADGAIAPRELMLVPGEHMVFEVHLHGIDVGKAELEVGETEVTSRFATDSLAAALVSVHHDLSTVLDRPNARAALASENLVVGSETKHFDFDGKNGQTVHTTLGLLRAWVTADAAPGFITIVELGHRYRMTVKRPLVEDLQGTKTFHVSATLNTKTPTTVEMWFTVSPEHMPLRFEVLNDDVHATATLVPA